MLLTPLFVGALVEFLPKFSTSEVWQRLQDSSSNLEMKTQKPITVFSGVPTMYVRLLRGFNTMDTEAQKACSFAARNLRLMVSLSGRYLQLNGCVIVQFVSLVCNLMLSWSIS
jgi:malonyl-CoA/methylmalonyl-CoA synthetase